MQALAAGQLDGNSQTLNDTISFAGDAVNGMVAVLVNDNSAGNDKIIGAEGIDTVADLAGKTVALEEGVVGDFLLSLALEDAG
jgi:NitT/TauT family transport system substrate-binding protein